MNEAGTTGEPWPDGDEYRHWSEALAAVAARITAERGVDDASSLTNESGALWANWGELRIRVAGRYADDELRGEEDLFHRIDSWIAFGQRRGADHLIERDKVAVARYRETLPAAQAIWQEAADVFFRDIRAATDLDWTPRVTIHEDEQDFSGLPGTTTTWSGEGYASTLTVTPVPMGWEAPRRQLALPELWLETPCASMALFGMPESPLDALLEVADNAIDWVMDELYTVWPPCPTTGHGHPLDVTSDDVAATWVCPKDSRVSFPVGELPAS